MKIDTTDDSISCYNGPSGAKYYGINFDGNSLWCAPNGHANLLKIDPSHPESGNWSYFPIESGNSGGMIFDGENIWIVPQQSGLIKLSPQEFGRHSIHTDGVLNVGSGFTVNRSGTVIAPSGRFINGIQIGSGSGSLHLSPNGDFSIPGASVNVADMASVVSGSAATSDLLSTSGVLQGQIDILKGLDWQESVLNRTHMSPSGGESTGDRYLVPAGASGAWSGEDDNIVEYNGAGWDSMTPTEGAACWIEDENLILVNNGSAWVVFGSVISHNNLGGVQGGLPDDFYHITGSQRTDLTDGGDSPLHYHQSDIDAANLYTDGASGILRASLSENDTAIASLSGQVISNDADIFELQVASGDLDSRVISNDMDIAELQASSGDLNNRVNSNDSDILELQVASGNLDNRVIANDGEILELQVASGNLDGRVISNDADILELQGASGNLDNRVTSNDSDILELQVASGELRQDVNSNDTDIAELQVASGNLDGRIISNDSDISTNATNISLNDDDIAEIQAVSGTFTLVDGSRSFINPVGGQTPTDGSHLATKDYTDSLVQGIDWKESVSGIMTSVPAGMATDSRFIVGNGCSSPWDAHENDVAEWNGSSWEYVTPTEGAAVWVEGEDVLYVFNATDWVKFGTTANHNNLAGIQGGAADDNYHLTQTRHTDLTDGGSSALHFHQADRDYSDNELLNASGALRTDVDLNAGNITSNDTDISNLQLASGNLNSRVISNDVDILELQIASGNLNSRIAANDSDMLELQVASGILDSRIISNDADILELQVASGNLDNRVNSNDSDIASNDTDIAELQVASGILRTDVDSNDVEIAALQAVSGNFYEKNQDLVPTADAKFNVGHSDYRFKDIHSVSGHYTGGLHIDGSGTVVSAIQVSSTSSSNVVAIENKSDAVAIDIAKVNGGTQPIIRIANSGTGADFLGTNACIMPNGDFYAASGALDSLTVGGEDVVRLSDIRYETTITSWTYDSGQSLYWADVVHNLGKRIVLAQYYNTLTYDSVSIDHHTHTDTNTVRAWSFTNDNLGVIISK